MCRPWIQILALPLTSSMDLKNKGLLQVGTSICKEQTVPTKKDKLLERMGNIESRLSI